MKRREDYERDKPPDFVSNLNETTHLVQAERVRVVIASEPDDPSDRFVAVKIQTANETIGLPLTKESADALIAQLIHARNKVWPTP